MFTKKFIVSFIIIVVLSTILVYSSSADTGIDNNYINTSTLILIGDDIDYPPYSFLDEAGNPTGFNIELAKAVAEVMGFQVQFKLNHWHEVMRALKAGEIHGISGMFYSSDRENDYGFSMKHTVASGDVFTRKDLSITSLEDLAGLKVVVQADDILHEFFRKENVNIEFIEAPTVADALRLVASGAYDYAAVLKLPAYYIIDRHNLTNLKANGLHLAPQDYSMAVDKENVALLSTLNEGLVILRATGRYQDIYDQWLGIYEEKDFWREFQRYAWVFYALAAMLISLLIWTVVLRRAVAYRTKELLMANADLQERKEELIASNEELEATLHQLVSIEKELEYLSYHDQLTGLYNRRFFEEELKRLDNPSNLPLTIIMGDVNGLKLTNDAFGHAVGDQLLKKVSEVLKAGCRPEDIIARLGGDEFIILLPNTDDYKAEAIVKQIIDLTLKEKVESIDLSISFGWGTKYEKDEKIHEILRQAEDYMYRKKLFESPSMRGKTIGVVINTLHEKNKREEQHSHRVSELCKTIGKVLDFSEAEIQELTIVGLLHDIGKIAIEENILNKPGKLTDEEWMEIQRHPEIGYRILSSANDMSEMAEYVLAHHERWDGKGYPKGLKRKEIPLQSRIIAIIDAYDAMTSERSYRLPLSQEEAIDELNKHAGTQFDPSLVKVFIQMLLDK